MEGLKRFELADGGGGRPLLPLGSMMCTQVKLMLLIVVK